MSDVFFHEWREITDKSVRVSSSLNNFEEAECIPDWAAILVAAGAVLAIVGFVAAWVTDHGWAPLLLTVGLIIAAIGMKGAESCVNAQRNWRPVSNA
jgi:cell division protein FtsW (lipid II flippase)